MPGRFVPRRSGFLKSARLATPLGDDSGKEPSSELLDKGFQLAYFLFPDYSTALNILGGALEKLEVQCQREKKRLFWRDKHPAQPVRRITRKDSDMLQWLIMREAEEYEKEQERVGSPSRKEMIVRYIKHLAQITTAMSSFYVNIGMTRLLCNYSTSEAQLTYETLTHRYLGPDEYRRAKAVLMDRIKRRFLKFLKVTTVEHGENRFEVCNDQRRWAGLVSECLKAFTPWSTEGLCSEFVTISTNSKFIPPEIGRDDIDQNEREMNWCHVLLEPTCSRRLMKELVLDMPETKLSLPKFSIEKSEKNDDSATQSQPSVLSPEARDILRKRLAEAEGRRRKLRARFVSLAVDGVPRAQLDLTVNGQLQIELEEGANLIEIRAEDNRGSLLVATYWVPYLGNSFGSSKGTAILNNSRIEVTITPIVSSSKGPARATLTVNYHPKFDPIRPWTAWLDLGGSWRPVWSYALTGLVTAVVTLVLTSAFYKHRITLLEQTEGGSNRTQGRQLQTEKQAAVRYSLVPDDQRVRTQETIGIPAISFHSKEEVVILDVPVGKMRESETFSADLEAFSGDRVLMTQNFLRTTSTVTAAIPSVAIIVPTTLLNVEKYYTVQLYSMGPAGRSGLINRFTFKVTSSQ